MINKFKKFLSTNTGFIIRLDDIAENMNWDMMEKVTNLFDKFGVKYLYNQVFKITNIIIFNNSFEFYILTTYWK